MKKLAKYGCYSIAVVYLMVGLMAILSFLGLPEDAADEERIMSILLNFPMGEVIIGGIVAGLTGYIIWRFYEAFTDHYNYGNGIQSLARRVGIAFSALGYAIIAWAAIQVLIHGGSNGEDEQKQLVASVLELSGGPWLVGFAGALTGFAGLVQIKYAASGEYKRRIDLKSMPYWLKKVTPVLAWAGYLARTVILSVLAFFILSAAITSNPDEVGDTDSAFDFLGDFGLAGHITFIAVALGTIGYGLYMILHGYFYSFEEEKK